MIMLKHAMKGFVAVGLAAVFAAAPVAVAEDDAPGINVGGVSGDDTTGSITGIVKFDGKQAPRRPIDMSTDAFCNNAHDEPARQETFVFGENDTLQNVFVYITGGLEGKDIPDPERQAVLDQHGCVYTPHVSGVVTGQTLTIKNSDQTLHNVKLVNPQKNPAFNQSTLAGASMDKTFSNVEMPLSFACDVHAWMNAYVYVVAHPFFAVTQDKGTFEIHGLPPGKYQVSVSHEFSRFEPVEGTVEVTVAAGQKAEANFTYQVKKQ